MKRSDFVAAACATAVAPLIGAVPVRRFRVAVYELGSSLDPYRDPALDVDHYAWIFGDGLTTGEKVPRPSLADIPQSRDGGRTWRYDLRATRWHDGRPVQAADVAYAFRTLHDMASPWLTYEPYSLVDEVVVRGSDVFDVRLHRASASFVRTFFSPYGRPALPLLRHDGDGSPIGTGPFRLLRRFQDRYAFEAYDGSPRGAAASAALEVRLVPSRTTLGLELAAGEVDLVLPIVRGLPGSERYRLVSRHNGTIIVLFNCTGAFRTPALRYAALRTFDVDELQRTVDPGFESRVGGVLPPGDPNDVEFPFPRRDVARAREELRPIREPVTIVHLAENRRYATLALLIAQMLNSAGVATEIVPRPLAMYQSTIGPLRSGRFDLAVSGLPYDGGPDLAADWGCASAPPHGGNFARWCDPAFDRAAAASDLRGALALLVRGAPFFPLARNEESFGVAPATVGFDVPPPFVPPTLSAQRWTLRHGT
ncbi:MAG: ABC transporter substrate-binding protein [Candidatus Eremiobacteraeota bacterium]|nr:ABC transporter substrate-binding protein [Candidatus Eremiobacteraeota bacterium]